MTARERGRRLLGPVAVPLPVEGARFLSLLDAAVYVIMLWDRPRGCPDRQRPRGDHLTQPGREGPGGSETRLNETKTEGLYLRTAPAYYVERARFAGAASTSPATPVCGPGHERLRRQRSGAATSLQAAGGRADSQMPCGMEKARRRPKSGVSQRTGHARGRPQSKDARAKAPAQDGADAQRDCEGDATMWTGS
jgi:hypothetical protein